MNFDFTEEQKLFADSVRKFAQLRIWRRTRSAARTIRAIRSMSPS